MEFSILFVRQRPQFNDVFFHSIELIFRGLILYCKEIFEDQ